MRKFIVSDLHGNGNMYNSIVSYLENLSRGMEDDVILYINGDLIDRGDDSASMLLDVINRITYNRGFKIEYLGGNHELLMHQASLKRKNGVWKNCTNWLWVNGGYLTANALDDLISIDEEEEIIKFVSNLKIYHKFKETLNDKQIVLVHAKCPKTVLDNCNLKISDNRKIEKYVWTRKDDGLPSLLQSKIGNKDYFTIIGHTPNRDNPGYTYYEDENYINIDGGCAGYVYGHFEYDHTPLVEIDSENNRLIILTFNNTNEIICGNYFIEGISYPMNDIELEKYRKYIDKKVKIKELILD